MREITIILAIMALAVSVVAISIYRMEHRLYVRGVNGSTCYESNRSHGNIRYPKYFSTADDCLASIPISTTLP